MFQSTRTLRRPTGPHCVYWSATPSDSTDSSGLRVEPIADGFLIHQERPSEWFVEVIEDPIHLGDKWLVQASVEVAAGRIINIASTDRSGEPLEIAKGPAVVTIAVRNLDAYDIIEGIASPARGRPDEDDIRLHARVPSLAAQRDAAPPSSVRESSPAVPGGIDPAELAQWFEGDATVLIRTSFGDDPSWSRLVEAVMQPVAFDSDDLDEEADETGYQANIAIIDDPVFDGATGATLAAALPLDTEGLGYALLADATSISEAAAGHELTLVYVDLSGYAFNDAELFSTFPGRSFRCVVAEVASIEANLAIGNMDFHEFADNKDPDGVFRGFS